jgi:hypothetical protein
MEGRRLSGGMRENRRDGGKERGKVDRDGRAGGREENGRRKEGVETKWRAIMAKAAGVKSRGMERRE